MKPHDDPLDHPDLQRLASREPSRLADLVARVVHPFATGTVMVFAVALHACWPRLGAALGWGLVALLGVTGTPLAILALCLRIGWVSDLNVVRQDERLRPLVLGLVAVAVAMAVIWAAGAPWPVVALMISLLVGVGVLTVLTIWEKVSFHAAGAGALMAVLGIGVTPWGWLAGAVALVGVGWARVRAGRHSLRQVLLGATVGVVVVGGAFWMLTRG